MTALGSPRLHLRETDSTNARARELALAGALHGTLVTAAHQTAGRGRQGRSWSAPPGRALLCSLILHGPPSPLTPLAAGVAVAELAGRDALVKWPNDVLVDGLKVAGVLAEGRLQEGWVVLGIGVNVAARAEELPPLAGTLGLEQAAIETCLTKLLRGLERWLAATPDDVLETLRARDALRGRAVSWGEGTGTADGIDGEGRLLVRTAGSGRVALGAGEVHLEPV
ncbi:MAG: biotin--[acetyl-CoA-carboxylase] ligase [Solirubrobacteraceae bacterium]